MVHGIEENDENGGPSEGGEKRLVNAENQVDQQEQHTVGKNGGQTVTGRRVVGRRSEIVGRHIMLIGRAKADNFPSTLQQVARRQPSPTRMSTKSIPLNPYQVRLLAVLALINFVNFAARQVFVPLIPLLRDNLHVTDAELGSLQTFLLLVLAVGSIPFGFLADRFSRKAIIGAGILFWSVATFV